MSCSARFYLLRSVSLSLPLSLSLSAFLSLVLSAETMGGQCPLHTPTKCCFSISSHVVKGGDSKRSIESPISTFTYLAHNKKYNQNLNCMHCKIKWTNIRLLNFIKFLHVLLILFHVLFAFLIENLQFLQLLKLFFPIIKNNVFNFYLFFLFFLLLAFPFYDFLLLCI